MLRGFILAVHVLLALMIIGLVLLQRGKGAEAGAGRCARHQHVVFEIDGGVRGAVLRDQSVAGLFGDAHVGRTGECVGTVDAERTGAGPGAGAGRSGGASEVIRQ
jgi:protein translocase SecG subunit